MKSHKYRTKNTNKLRKKLRKKSKKRTSGGARRKRPTPSARQPPLPRLNTISEEGDFVDSPIAPSEISKPRRPNAPRSYAGVMAAHAKAESAKKANSRATSGIDANKQASKPNSSAPRSYAGVMASRAEAAESAKKKANAKKPDKQASKPNSSAPRSYTGVMKARAEAESAKKKANTKKENTKKANAKRKVDKASQRRLRSLVPFSGGYFNKY